MKNMPKRTKYRKMQRGSIRGDATRGHTVSFGDFGIQATQGGWLSSRVIEAGRVAATRAAPGSRLYIRIFPQRPVSKKPAETRQGKGKGEAEYWAAVVKPGTVLYELAGVNKDQATVAFNRVAHKLPISCRLVERRAR